MLVPAYTVSLLPTVEVEDTNAKLHLVLEGRSDTGKGQGQVRANVCYDTEKLRLESQVCMPACACDM